MLKRLYLLFVLINFTTLAIAQNGSITGKVIDAGNKEPVIGANAVIQGTTVGSSTDLDGNFTIANLKPGTYTVAVSFVTYKTHVIPDVTVESGKIISIAVELNEDATELEEVIVTGTRQVNTDYSLVAAIKESKLVVSGISAEQIARVPDRDAAQIMQRVPGISIVDNRFVMIRGVSERYNQVMINKVIGPSTEVDKRSFSFDLIPSGAIDQILIYKSGSADIPGDFAGGVIQVVTRQFNDENYFKVSTSLGMRAGTTFNDFNKSQGSSTDWLGYDNGFRSLPATFPSTNAMIQSSRTSELRQNAGRSLTNNFDYSTVSAPVDFGFGFELSHGFNLGRLKLGTLTNVAYSNSYQNKVVNFKRYLFDNQSIEDRFNYNDTYSENDVRISGISNWLATIGKSRFEFKNLINLLGENQTILRDGQDLFLNTDRFYRNYSYHYQSRFIYTGQLQGTHKLADNSVIIDWVGGYNYVNRDEPDFRRFRTFRLLSSGEETYQMQLPPSANLFETGRFYSDLQDKGFSNGVNIEKKFGDVNNKRTASVKAGYYIESKERDFNARYVSYLYPGFFNQEEGQRLIRLPLNEVFAPGNIKSSDGFVLEEGTRPSDTYTGSNFLTAGYVMGTLPAGKFDLTAGVRLENNVQKLNTISVDGPVEVNNPILSVLPSLNMAYNLTDRSLFRLAYSRTVNRPEFRELAPFLYYDFELEQGVQGNPNLRTATIDNIDLRWEIYPNPGEAISLGMFYKSFNDPIESILLLTTEAPQSTYGNADMANAYGVELEFKKSLSSLGVSRFLRNTSINMNASFIFSEVDLGAQATAQQQVRQLQGQSPYLINAGAYYNDDVKKFAVSVAYNIFGPRIFAVGDVNFPSIYELPRHSLDLQLSKQFGKLETKLNIQNLVNAKYRFYQDTDVNNKIDTQGGRDASILAYTVGQQISISLGYKISR
ncbi:MAG: carboxypeptidase-like regulatory domain-containing protein [Cyclobacteriaceae bacterium]|nr:carboxypeptidase-like regulatory domain-containing protein [Cyclobacteriaceae bacterium]